MKAVQKFSAGFAEVGRARGKEFFTPLAVAAFLGVAAVLITGSALVYVWAALVILGQAGDRWASTGRTGVAERAASRMRLAFCVLSVLINGAINTGIAPILWIAGGKAGWIFAIPVIAGTLLHATLHATRSPILLGTSTTPMGAHSHRDFFQA